MTPAPVDHDARREQLTAVLLEVVASGGLEGASIRTVAAAAGVSIGTVQHYFATKDDLLRHAYRSVGADLAARAAASAAGARSPRGAIRAVLMELLPLDPRREAALRVTIAFAAHAVNAPELAGELRRGLRAEVAAAFAAAGVLEADREALLALAVASGLTEPLLFGDVAVTDVLEALDTYLDRAVP